MKILIFLLAAIPGLACTCVVDAGPACSLFHKTEVIFRGHAWGPEVKMGRNGIRLYRFRVEEAFKGLAPGTTKVFVDSGAPGSCYRSFDTNQDYLIYTGSYGAPRQHEGISVFTVDQCSPSRPIQPEDSDLPYLRDAVAGKLPSSGWIEGTAVQNRTPFMPLSAFVPVAGALVTAQTGDETRTTRTGPDGRYQIPNLKSGTFRMRVAKEAFGEGTISQSAVVPPGGCTNLTANFASSAAISGIVFTASGAPVSNVEVGLGVLLPDGTLRRLPDQWVRTKADGTFRMTNVPVGEIVMQVKDWYAPGVASLAQARIFQLRADENVTGVEFRLPPSQLK